MSAEDAAAIAAERAAMDADAATHVKAPVADVADVDAGGVPARLYRPGPGAGTLLYLHGGGFVFGTRDTHDAIARRLAVATGWSVLLPDYRLAPEHPYPAAVDDTRRAADWLADRAQESGGQLAVVGDSAGGNLALGEALRRRYAAAVLVYPFLDIDMTGYDADRDNADLTMAEAGWYWQQYLQGDDDPAADPSTGADLAAMPRTLIQLASDDILAPVGESLAARMAAAGASVACEVYDGVPHGFWRQTDNPQAGPALAALAAFLNT